MSDRIRLVVMGDSRVGKSSIVKRFLFGEFNVKHIPTIEDLFSRDFELGEQPGGNGKPNMLKVDILDTAGDAQFPAMRRLSIASAHAFLLVYSITDASSFTTVKERFEEIREQRADFQDIPIVIAGNKSDMVNELDAGDVESWSNSNLIKNRSRLVECSARTNYNIREVFKAFLFLSKIAPNVNTSRSSSRRTSDEDSKLSGNGKGGFDKNFNFPRSDEIILTSPHNSSPILRGRYGSLKGRPSSTSTNSLSQKASPLRRNLSAYGRTGSRPGMYNQKEDGEFTQEGNIAGNRRKFRSGNKLKDLEPLDIHFEQDMVEHSTKNPENDCKSEQKPHSPMSKILSLALCYKSPTSDSSYNQSTGKTKISPKSSVGSPTDMLNKKNNGVLKFEEINTGGCGTDPATYNRGRNSKRSQSLIRRSSKKLKNQVPAISNTDDCIIS